MSLMDFAVHMDSLDHGFSLHDLMDPMDQMFVDDIMAEMTVDMTIEEEISQLQYDGLLDLSDYSGLPCKLGIEATDMGSLLEQFEEASQTLGDCDLLVPSLNIDNSTSVSPEPSCVQVTQTNDNIEKKGPELTPEVIQRIRSLRKQKTAVMLPLAVPAKRGRGRAMTRGHPVALPASCTPLRLQRVMKQSQELLDCLPLAEEPNMDKGVKLEKKEEFRDVEDNYYDLIIDHDYPKNVTNPKIDDEDCDNEVNDDIEEGEVVEDKELVSEQFRKTSDKHKHGRHYRRKGESPEINYDSSLYFDKLPSYYTALSIPQKQFRKTASCASSRGGISVHDYIERGGSPVNDTSMYSKLPDYYSSFTNSTKYDSLSYTRVKDADECKDSGYSSLNHTPTPSESRSRSYSRSLSRSVSRSRSQHSHRSTTRDSRRRRSSNSPYSECSRSCSRSSCSCSDSSSSSSRSCSSRSPSCSRSRSRSAERSWQRERNMRGERSQRRSRSRAHSRSRSRDPRLRNSRSRDYRSRSRSSSRPRSNRRRLSAQRLRESRASVERRREQQRKEKEEEKQRQMKERRIVYVGGIPESLTKNDLKKKFSRFGEIEQIQLHFREHGDNYGFVTFVYTCDAYAAIEKGRKIPELEKFDLCFGGRRQFCDVEYADLDGNKEVEEEYDPKPRKQGTLDFDEMLRQARQGLKKS